MPNLWPATQRALLFLIIAYLGWVVWSVASSDCHWGFRALQIIGARCESLGE
jgi:hypothetical protein